MPPMLSATTHPDLVAEIVRLCLAAGAAAVIVTDNSINDPVSCFELTGIAPRLAPPAPRSSCRMLICSGRSRCAAAR